MTTIEKTTDMWLKYAALQFVKREKLILHKKNAAEQLCEAVATEGKIANG